MHPFLCPCELGTLHEQSGSKAGLLFCVDLVEAIYVGDSFDPVEALASFSL